MIENFLRRSGIDGRAQIEEVVSGFDLDQPVYERWLHPEDQERIFQYVRNVSADKPDSRTGTWFCLAGASMAALAIFGGLAGRRLVGFKVISSVLALEGTAAPMSRNWRNEFGTDQPGIHARRDERKGGGATQLFLPRNALYCLVAEGG